MLGVRNFMTDFLLDRLIFTVQTIRYEIVLKCVRLPHGQWEFLNMSLIVCDFSHGWGVYLVENIACWVDHVVQ